ncbi:MAG TPA: NAD(P)-dependent oxidoreductase [Cytophagales bacterium]|jgi:3-hydroxy acid dehydrogenase/malonic semialdehyde reductase|nr:NAD(P)-dependent oxidoreductase [Cytophagales bacterium]
MNKTVLITGATAGIGKATAELLAQHKFNLIICGRRKDRLVSMQKALETFANVHIGSFDIRDKEAVSKFVASLPIPFSKIDVLINNAGNAHGLDEIHEGSTDDWEAMIDINVKGLLYMSRAVSPQMVERKSGHIINIGSIAGKEPYMKGNVYCGSKHAVDAINHGMRMDLFKYGVKVSQICPGLVNTEFSDVRFKGDHSKSEAVYQGMTPLKAEDIAEIIHFVITRPKHVNISDTIVLPLDQAASTMVHRQ